MNPFLCLSILLLRVCLIVDYLIQLDLLSYMHYAFFLLSCSKSVNLFQKAAQSKQGSAVLIGQCCFTFMVMAPLISHRAQGALAQSVSIIHFWLLTVRLQCGQHRSPPRCLM